nr:YidC/Oxa1 family membrane protein insertase [Desulfuribacillus stibiiarsenatis]
MSQRRFSSKAALLLLLVFVSSIFMTGCTVEQMQQTELDRSGIWGSFVGILSDLMDYVGETLGSYGVAILVVTIIIRFITLPFMIKQMKSMKAMQRLQPEMTKLKEKYKDNQQKLNEETMKLFQKHNVNPLAGCLPLIIQMPILIAFYQSIMYNVHIREASFLFFELGQKDPTYILPILAALTTYLQQKTMTISQDNPQAKALLYLMPAMILFISATLPSALGLYWVYSNIFSIAQNYFMYRDTGVKQEAAK